MGLKTEQQLEDHLDECDNVVRSCTCCQISMPQYVLREENFPCEKKFTNSMELSMKTSHIIQTDLSVFEDQIG